ncbi:MAG TPA: FmdB family zinc ribbon protein [Pyrinomonadaceae bacterium]|nr:FmdB family zinc ribbon protein [Pyrinomonadaceae bacterium]
MPIYEYRCKKCAKQTEVLVRAPAKPPTRCRECGGRLEKLISSPAIQFKGEGWYVTDYARKGSVAEKVEKELSSDTSSEKSKGGDKEKPKPAAKKTDKA